MYLESFKTTLKQKLSGSLFSVSDAKQINRRAKEYLHRLSKSGEVQRIHQGWYYIPKKQDVWEFLAKDKNFKVLIKQTAASIWNYDFIHRNIYRLAVEDQSYKNAVEKFAKDMGWLFEVEYHEKIPYEYRKVDELFVESPESCIVSCISEWAFMDAFATLCYKRSEIDFDKLRRLGRWKRISKTHIRVWTAIKYGCKLLNEQLGRSVFKVRATNLEQNYIKELIEEASGRMMEFA